MPYPCLSTLFLSPPYSLLSSSWYKVFRVDTPPRFSTPVQCLFIWLLPCYCKYWRKRSQCSVIHKPSHILELSGVVNERHINFSFPTHRASQLNFHCHNNKHSMAELTLCKSLLLFTTNMSSFIFSADPGKQRSALTTPFLTGVSEAVYRNRRHPHKKPRGAAREEQRQRIWLNAALGVTNQNQAEGPLHNLAAKIDKSVPKMISRGMIKDKGTKGSYHFAENIQNCCLISAELQITMCFEKWSRCKRDWRSCLLVRNLGHCLTNHR